MKVNIGDPGLGYRTGSPPKERPPPTVAEEHLCLSSGALPQSTALGGSMVEATASRMEWATHW